MGYIFTFFILGSIYIWLMRSEEIRSYYPTLIFSGLLGTVSDLLGVVNKQWFYRGPEMGGLSLWSVIGIAPVEGGLFIKLFPKGSNLLIKVGYWFGWSILNTLGELFFVKAGWIGYIQWNSRRAFLYYLFFFGAIWLQEYWYNGTGRVK